MPNRVLRPWLDSEAMNSLSESAEVFYVRLIMAADDYGCYHGSPQLLKSYLYPLKDKRVADISRLIAECVKAGVLAEYEVSGKRYLKIIKFRQFVRQKGKRKFPLPPPEILALDDEDATPPRRACSADAMQAQCNGTADELKTDRKRNADAAQTQSTCVPNTETICDIREERTSKKESRFAPPSIEEVRQYCLERKNGIDANAFVSYYESKGWMIGKNRMKDWKAAVRTWESRRKEETRQNTVHPSFDYAPDESGTDENKWGFQ